MAKNKTTFAQFEIGQTVRLTRAILRYSDAMRGIEFNPPQVLFAVGTLATVLERKPNSDSYVIVMADSTFVISRHTASLEAVPNEPAPVESLDAEYDAYRDEQPEPEWHESGYIGDGFTNEYDYDHPVHGNAANNAIQSGAAEPDEPECAKCGRLLDGDGRCWHCDYSEAEQQALLDATVDEPKSMPTDELIAGIVSQLRCYAAAAAQIEEQKTALRERLAALLAERGEAWKDEAGYARLTSGGTRISYDTDELDARLITEPDRYQWLRDIRKATPIRPTVQVK